MLKPNLSDFPAVVKQVIQNTSDIEDLKEHNKKHDDSMDQLTKSNVLLAASIREMNATLISFTSKVEKGQPIIDFWNRIWIAFGVSRDFAKVIVSIALGIAALAAVYKLFF